MPGIAGVIGPAGREPLQAYVAAMLATMRHEPAWVSTVACAPELGVCAGAVHRNGSYAATHSADSGAPGIALMFCGECADEPALAPTAGGSLLQRFADEGVDLVVRLNGQFSGVLIDRPGGKVVLFNDRYGSERIYCHERGGLLFFASEAKALLAVAPETRAFDDEGVADFLAMGCPLDGRTLFRGVSLLPAASLWTFAAQGCSVARTRYFDPLEWERQEPLDEARFCSALAQTLEQALPRHLSSMSKIGLSVTGGLDTRMILACLPADRAPPLSYTYAGARGLSLDCRLGAQVSALRGITHHILRIGADFLSHYRDYVDQTVYLTDGCAGAADAHELYFTALARQLATIRLTGNFGSEVLRGMATHKPLHLDATLFDAGVAPLLAQALQRATAADEMHPVSRAAFREVPWHLHGTVAAARAQLVLRTPYLDNDVVQMAYRAPPSLRRSATPALALVASRDARLAAIPTDRGLRADAPSKRPFASRVAAELAFKLDYLHTEGLPDWLSAFDRVFDPLSRLGLLGHHKYLPYRGWFRKELAQSACAVAADSRTQGLPYWNLRSVENMVAEHVQGRRNRLREIHALLTLEAVQRLLFGSASAATGARNPLSSPAMRATTP
jgi:asparagine synthase (glutamine-hydrolysing)